MAFLIFCEHAGTLAKGAHTPQCPEDSSSYEFRSVGDVLDGLMEFMVHFKGNNTLLFFHLIHLLLNPILSISHQIEHVGITS